MYGLIGPRGPGKSNWKGTYSNASVTMLRNYVGTRAVAIVKIIKIVCNIFFENGQGKLVM